MKSKLWFGVYGRKYGGDEPAFFDDDFTWRVYLEEQFPSIKAALEPLMRDVSPLQPYFDDILQFPPKNWKTLGPVFWGKKTKDYPYFIELNRILAEIPGVCSVSFNMLEPQSRIMPHFGETNAVYRVHLGVKIPRNRGNCTFTVNGESRPWEEGKTLVFLDANTHEARNDTDERRYILLLDVIRPEFASQRRRICVQALSMLSLYWVIAHVPFLPAQKIYDNAHHIPKWLTWSLIQPLRLIWSLAWPFVCFRWKQQADKT